MMYSEVSQALIARVAESSTLFYHEAWQRDPDTKSEVVLEKCGGANHPAYSKSGHKGQRKDIQSRVPRGI
jgi:hypothetical protein